jgi:hypothetical protein
MVEAKAAENQQPTPHTYREDIDRKDQRRALLDEGSTPMELSEDNPTCTDATTPMTNEDDGTYKTLSK